MVWVNRIVEVLNLLALTNALPEWTLGEKKCPTDSCRPPLLPQAEDIPPGVPDRALLTLPLGLRIYKSTIKNAGYGVFSDIFIPSGTWLGEYEGEIVVDTEISPNGYAWGVNRGGKVQHHIDGWNPSTSNWLRYVNCPRRRSEENVKKVQCFDKIYYVTSTDVHPGEELMVFYGSAYAKALGIDMRRYHST